MIIYLLKEGKEKWEEKALTIAKDIHEIKKDYILIVRGFEELINHNLNDYGMYFFHIMDILEESIILNLTKKSKKIKIDFQKEHNFFTEYNCYIMSIFRNLVMNSIDAIDECNNNYGIIKLIYEEKKSNH